MSESILQLSKRTVGKIFTRLKIGCSNCGWDQAPGDIHHITPKSKGGTDDHDNLSYLCPNCHRLAHRGSPIKFVTLANQIGNTWLAHYFPEKSGRNKRVQLEQSSARRREKEQRRLARVSKIEETRQKLLSSAIDFTKFGWVAKASPIIGVTPQKVSRWMNAYMKDFYRENCFRRK